MSGYDYALDQLITTAARILSVRGMRHQSVYGVGENDLQHALWLVSSTPDLGEQISKRLLNLPNNGLRADPDYVPIDPDRSVRLGGFNRYLSGIPLDFAWWTNDPHNILAW